MAAPAAVNPPCKVRPLFYVLPSTLYVRLVRPPLPMIDVTAENFEAEVITASMSVPVLVDFWAPWCAPCKTLGPVLEKLETAYAGRFKLVKIDSDQEQQIAAMFGIRSIPTCILLMNGQPTDGFQGALPEGKVREFLDRHLPPADEAALPPEEELSEAETPEVPEETAENALEALRQAVLADPASDDARFAYIKRLLQHGQDDDAKVAFAPVIAKADGVRRLDALQRWMNAIDSVANYADLTAACSVFDILIATNKRDFDARFGRAQALMAAQRWTDAMDELLDILMRDRTWNHDLARKTYIAILELIEPPKIKVADGQIPPDDPTLASYRRRLSSVILS